MRYLNIRVGIRVATFVAATTCGIVSAHAQAWLPAKGEGSVSVLFTNVLSREHFLPDQRFDFGHIDSNTMLVDLTYGLSDRVAVSVGLPVVVARYRGPAPHRPITLDDGAWHTTAQDFRFNVRFAAVRGPVMITPFASSDVPSNSYEFFSHAAPGRRLKELHGGVAVGRLFADLGVVLQGRYSLAFSEGALESSRRYSLASLEGVYFLTPSVRLIGMTTTRFGHTGIDLTPTSGRDLPAEVFQHHDQLSRESYVNVGGGVGVSLNDTWDLFGSFTTTVMGRNTHAVNRGVSIGTAWRFRRGEAALSARAGREGTLVTCLCQKAE